VTSLIAAARRIHALLSVAGHPLSITAVCEITGTRSGLAHAAMARLRSEGCAEEMTSDGVTYYRLRRDG